MSAPATVLQITEIPDWARDFKSAKEAIARGCRYVPSKVSKSIARDCAHVKNHIRDFLHNMVHHTFSGEGSPSERDIAGELGLTQRMIQYDIADAIAAGVLEVEHHTGEENTYRFPMSFLIKAGALAAPKPKVEPKPAAPPPSPKEVNKVTQKSAYIYSCWYSLVMRGKTPEEADAELRLKFPEFQRKKTPGHVISGFVSSLQKAVGALAQEKSVSPPRAG